MPIQEKKYKEYLSQDPGHQGLCRQQGRCYSFSFRRGEAAVYDS